MQSDTNCKLTGSATILRFDNLTRKATESVMLMAVVHFREGTRYYKPGEETFSAESGRPQMKSWLSLC